MTSRLKKKKMTLALVVPTRVSGLNTAQLVLAIIAEQVNVLSRSETMKKKKCWNCEECIHSSQETTDDVACCNCCEDGSFFEQYRDEYTLADLGYNWW
jgi:hypothetical protein